MYVANLVFGSITNQSLGVCECDVTGCCAVTLIIGNDFNLAMLKHTDARVRGAQINTDSWCLGHFCKTTTQV